MPCIGFSTGSLALGDFERGLELVRKAKLKAVELSALREDEVLPLIRFIQSADLEDFDYVSVHAPSRLLRLSEEELVATLVSGTRDFPVVVHPDVITKASLWRALGARLCIENMDQRKRAGRTVNELRPIFDELPDASFCLDLAHAAQVDPTMTEARSLIREFGDRITQVHVSTLDDCSSHRPLDQPSAWAFATVMPLITGVPWILEGVVQEHEVDPEIVFAKQMAVG